MYDTFEVGRIYGFHYNGKRRSVKVEKVAPQLVTGFDYSVEGYRSFTKWKIEGAVVEETPNSGGWDQIGIKK